MTRDTQLTVWHLTSAWLSGTRLQRFVVGHVANLLSQANREAAGRWVPVALWGRCL